MPAPRSSHEIGSLGLLAAAAVLATLAAVDSASASVPWHLDPIDQRNLPLDGRFNPCASGAGVNIFIVSSGIDYDHPEFGGRALFFWDYEPGGDGSDHVGHGTWLASLAGGAVSGVARETMLHSVRAFDDCGRTTVAILRDALMHIGANAPRPAVAVLPFAFEYVPEINAAVEQLRSAGVLVVAAAGDEVRNACELSPGGSSAAITVGATKPVWDERAEWSAYGSCIDVYAGGEMITAAWPGEQTMTLDTTAASAALAGGVGAVYRGLGESLGRAERKLRECTSGSANPILRLDCGCIPGPVRDPHAVAAAVAVGAGATRGRSTSAPQHWYRLVDEIAPCPSDLDGDCAVGFSDLLMVLGGWGPCEMGFDSLMGIATRIGTTGYDVRGLAAPTPVACPLDLDGSGAVDFGDLLIVLSDWGPCD